MVIFFNSAHCAVWKQFRRRKSCSNQSFLPKTNYEIKVLMLFLQSDFGSSMFKLRFFNWSMLCMLKAQEGYQLAVNLNLRFYSHSVWDSWCLILTASQWACQPPKFKLHQKPFYQSFSQEILCLNRGKEV